jgi:thiamine-phosphate pyrophosphorylase
MQIVVFSPQSADPREISAMEGFFGAGLSRYHVRKPGWTAPSLGSWLRSLPVDWRPRLIVHGHRELAAELGLGGWHDRDLADDGGPRGSSRSCHDLPSLRRHLPVYGTLIFGPVFPSLTKPGYGPQARFPWDELASLLKAGRTRSDARVLAIGGVSAGGLARCRELGFDGAAVLGAVWSGADPLRAYREIRDAAGEEVKRHAA